MSEFSPPTPSEDTSDLKSLCAAVAQISDKIALITEAVKNLSQDRSQLEGKIDEAHKRVQRILSRLPDQSDGRQLNLLGEVPTPNNPEDDNEPTTH